MTAFAAMVIVPWVLALVCTPLAIRIAHAQGWVDRPTARKTHREPVAMLGGIAIYVSVVGGLLAIVPFVPELLPLFFGYQSLGVLFGCMALMVALGVWDDLRDLPALGKLAVQLAIATLTWFAGFRVANVELPFGLLPSLAEPIAFLITIGWITIVSNAFNLIDGMDGLAPGISLVTALTVFLLANQNGATVPIVAALGLAGALAGFLRWNLPPARIYLGDAGALGIGYLTSVLSLAAYQKSPAAVVLIVPLLVLGVPLLDTILAVLRRGIGHLRTRGLEGVSPLSVLRAVVTADRSHMHDLLLRNGLSVGRALAVLYALAVALAVVALTSRDAPSEVRYAIFAALIAAGYAIVRRLERRALEREQSARDAAERADAKSAAERDPQRAAG